MVAGKKDLINLPGVKRIDHDDYATTGELASLAAALESAAGETLVAFGDIQFRGDGAGLMLHDRADAAIAVDTWFREWAAGGRAGGGFGPPAAGAGRARDDRDDEEAALARAELGAPRDAFHGEGIGLRKRFARSVELARDFGAARCADGTLAKGQGVDRLNRLAAR